MTLEEHETVEYLMPIHVDRGILPLVAALNRYPTIQTESSCQGFLESEYERRAYVQFIAGRADIIQLIEALQESGEMREWELRVSDRGIHKLLTPRQEIAALAVILDRALDTRNGDLDLKQAEEPRDAP